MTDPTPDLNRLKKMIAEGEGFLRDDPTNAEVADDLITLRVALSALARLDAAKREAMKVARQSSAAFAIVVDILDALGIDPADDRTWPDSGGPE